jgi:hypothetical protein
VTGHPDCTVCRGAGYVTHAGLSTTCPTCRNRGTDTPTFGPRRLIEPLPFKAYPVAPGVYVVPSRSEPGCWWQPKVEQYGAGLRRTCQCKSARAGRPWCAHADAVCEVLAEHGLVERVGSRWAPPLPDPAGDEAVVADLLAHRARSRDTADRLGVAGVR